MPCADKKLREQMQLEVRRLHDRLGLTTGHVPHDQREALTMSDRIAVIDRGRIVQIDRRTLRAATHAVRGRFHRRDACPPCRVHDGRRASSGGPRLARPLLSAAPDQVLALRPEMFPSLRRRWR